MREPATILRQCAAEMAGTFVLVFFGTGAVHAAVLTGAQQGVWQVAVVWGIAVSLAIYATAAISGAHFNPAITVALMILKGFPAKKVPLYAASQLLGAVLAAAVLFTMYSHIVRDFESSQGIVRGAPGSELSAMAYGEYFPNPATARSLHWSDASVSHVQAMMAEAVGTAFLAFFVFALTDIRNTSGPGHRLFPLFIGLTVSIVISVIAPLTQAGLNPARDFGPRLFAYFAGWGAIAIPGPRGGFLTVYVVSPILGAVVGGAVYRFLAAPRRLAVDALVTSPASFSRRTRAMKQTQLVFVGGFLGAGKTTLLWHAAELLMKRGKRVGLITNDQAPDLVDTKWLAEKGLNVREVAGSCFCCSFPALIQAAESLRSLDVDVLIGEPVGSCTDLSATILQPLKDKFGDRFVLSPLSVLADPLRLRDVLRDSGDALHASAAYIFRKQLEEADLLVINKMDLVPREEQGPLEQLVAAQFPKAVVRRLSAWTGEGVESWLNEVLATRAAGTHIVDVNYDTYAEGEAVLGWLNAEIRLSTIAGNVGWSTFCSDLLKGLRGTLGGMHARIGHVKLLLTAGGSHCIGNLTSQDSEPFVQGQIVGFPPQASLTLNARVEMPPEELERIVRDLLSKIAGERTRADILTLRCLRPGRPKPTHRYKTIVEPSAP